MTLVKHRSKIYGIFLGKNGGAKQSSTIGIFVYFLMSFPVVGPRVTDLERDHHFDVSRAPPLP